MKPIYGLVMLVLVILGGGYLILDYTSIPIVNATTQELTGRLKIVHIDDIVYSSTGLTIRYTGYIVGSYGDKTLTFVVIRDQYHQQYSYTLFVSLGTMYSEPVESFNVDDVQIRIMSLDRYTHTLKVGVFD